MKKKSPQKPLPAPPKQKGGARGPRHIDTSFSALIGAVWDKFGGPAAVSRLIGEPCPQTPINWRFRGKVPSAKIIPIAEKLKIPPFALDYEGLSKVYLKSQVPSFKTVVKECKLDPETSALIVQMYDAESQTLSRRGVAA